MKEETTQAVLSYNITTSNPKNWGFCVYDVYKDDCIMSSCSTNNICTVPLWWLLTYQGGWGYFQGHTYYCCRHHTSNYVRVKCLHYFHHFPQPPPPNPNTHIQSSSSIYVNMDGQTRQRYLQQVPTYQPFIDAHKHKLSRWEIHHVEKYHVGVLGFNGLYPLTDDKEVPNAFIVLYVCVIFVYESFGQRRRFNKLHVPPTPIRSFFDMAATLQIMQFCEEHTVPMARTISCDYSQNFRNKF